MEPVRTKSWKQVLGAVAGLSALVFTFGCGGTRELNGPLTSAAVPTPAANTPVVVSCAPNQRTMVRPAVVNGVAVSQVECIAADPSAVAYPMPLESAPLATPIAYRTTQPVARSLNDTQIVPVAAPASTAHATPARQVVYQDDRPVVRKKTRSVAKSAVIIGSSAGAGAGLGAIVGGKKGALIGAAIGGGGATLWDQITRRKN